MTKREIALLACRIFALYAFLLFLLQVENTIGAAWGLFSGGQEIQGESRILVLAFLASSLLVLVLAAVIWQKADWLAAKIFPGEDSSEIKINATLADIQVVVFSVVGLVTIIHSLPQIGSLFVEYKMRMAQSINGHFPKTMFWRQGLIAGIEFVIGIGLLFGARGLSGLLRSLRKS